MGKRKEVKMKIDRMMAIIVLMLNRDKVTAKELAERFEVSVRTIYRDIDSIDMAGIPIIAYPGNNGGYGIMENYKLNNQLLTINNICSLITTLQGVNVSLNDSDVETSIEKLKALIPEHKINDLDLSMEQLIIDMPSWAKTSVQNQMIKDLRQAIHQSNLITIEYQDVKNKITTRQIEPMAIVFKGYTWHLFSYCRLKDDYRVFRLSRINHLTIEKETFSRRHKSYHETRDVINLQSKLICVTMKFDKAVKTKVEDIFAKEEIHYLKNNDMIVTTNFPDQDWYASLILSFGEHLEVISPDHVREEIASRIKAMYQNYKSI